MKYLFLATLFCLSQLTTWAESNRYAAKSAMAEGRWVKLRVDRTGIYRLSYADLRRMGFDDPSKVSVHGYGGWMIDEHFTPESYIDDLPAVAVWRGQDYLLFYGRGPVKWSYRRDYNNHITDDRQQFVHENNPYSSYGYYFVTDAATPHEIETESPVTGNASQQIDTFDDYAVHEVDEVSIKESGRELYGESFDNRTSLTHTFNIPGITADEGLVTLRFISGSAGSVSLTVNNSALFTNQDIRLAGLYGDEYEKGVPLFRVAPWTGAKQEKTDVTVLYSLSNKPRVHLDYIRLQMKRELRAYGDPYLFFRSLAAVGTRSRFNIRNASEGMMVFDVTDPVHIRRIAATIDGNTLSFVADNDKLHEYVLIDPAKSFPTPEQVGEVPNQNLHGLSQQQMIIVAPPAFTHAAERLAQHHRTHTGLTVQTVAPEQIYNEFSSGTPDASAIRRLMKMFYDRRTSEADAPRFLLLFGDGAYDNRWLTKAWQQTAQPDNFLPTYETYNSLNNESHVVDDYFGLLKDGDGDAIERDEVMLGIGRLPVRTVAQAEAATDKIIRYALDADAGSWKNRLCFVGDDGNGADGFRVEHMSDVNRYADTLEVYHPAYLASKQMFDAYKKTSRGGKMGYPDIEANIARQLKEGVFLIDYAGHGNATSLSDEQVITDAQIQAFTYPHLPLWITATCDFAPFDNITTSAGENVFLNPKSGGIALFTTTRVAYTGHNYIINSLILKNLFDRTSDGRRRTLGEALRETKKGYANKFRHAFCLLGDPALTLAFPEYTLRIVAVNGKPVADGETIAFKALEQITVEGEVYDTNGRLATDFNGDLAATVMDSRDSVTTLNNNNKEAFSYLDYGSTLQQVSETVANGRFRFSFTVPAFISYSGKPGKISLYALDNASGIEANGAFRRFTLAGTAANPAPDTQGPDIYGLYLNDTAFVDGNTVNATPYFIAQLRDSSGIYIGSGSVGHDITVSIDNDPLHTYSLNAYCRTSDGGRNGLVGFSLPPLPEGRHTARFKAFDIRGNSSTRTFTFHVSDKARPAVTRLVAAPSPAREQVTFMLSHNRPETAMTVSIHVYDLSGRLQWQHTESGSSQLFRSYQIGWNLTNGSGQRLKPGIYLYRAAIRTATSTEATAAQKLVVLGAK